MTKDSRVDGVGGKRLFPIAEARYQSATGNNWAEGIAYNPLRDSVHEYIGGLKKLVSPGTHALVIERNIHDPERREEIGRALYGIWWSAGLIAHTYLLDYETASNLVRSFIPDEEVLGITAVQDRVVELFAEGVHRFYPDVAKQLVAGLITDEIVMESVRNNTPHLLEQN